MGQRLSHLKSSKSNTKVPQQSESRRYPLPIENLMLQQIKKEYEASKDAGHNHNISSNFANGDGSVRSNELELNSNLKAVEDKESSESVQQLIFEHILKKFEVPDNHNENDYDQHSSSPLKEIGYDFEYADDNDGASASNAVNLIDFPILVVQRLLDYLTPQAILAMRATCKTTKAWIDNNAYILRNFEMRLEPELCKYHNEPPHTSPWSNFAIPFVHLDSDFIQDTIDNYSDIIWSLEVFAPKTICSTSNYPSNHPRRMFDLIGRCHLLQILKICRIDTLTQFPENNDCFKLVRVLSIDRIQWMNHSDFPLFEKLIMKCPLLEYLKVPEFEILGSLAFIFYDQHASPEKEHLIRPLLRYLDYYRRPPEIGNEANATTAVARAHGKAKQAKLYIDVVEFEDFKLCSSEIFYELSRKCLECNAVLMNVYFVPRDAAIRNEQDIVESFASMFGFIKIDFRAELWKNLEVMECWIEEFPDDLDLTIRQFEFLKTVSKIQTLRSLTIRMSVDDPDICSGALDACVGQTYLGIVKLILRRHQVVPDTYVRIPPGFGNAFRNLKYLYFQELDSRNEDFEGLWPNLPNLEELFVYKCPHLTQEAFIGQNEQQEAPMLRLTKLQILVIFLYDGIGGFNDDFLVKGLRYMKLKGFALRGAAGVEFTDHGMLSLLNSPFHDTIEDFEAPSSCFRPTLSSNYWSFYIALPKKELRRNRIWLSCSVLLNSLSSRKHPYDFKRKCLGI